MPPVLNADSFHTVTVITTSSDHNHTAFRIEE